MDQSFKIQIIKYFSRVLVLLLIIAFPVRASVLLKGIHISDNPFTLALAFDSELDWRLYQTGPKEFVIALKDVSVSKKLAKSGSDNKEIQSLVYKKQQGDNALLIVETLREISSVDSSWRKTLKVLEINIAFKSLSLAHKKPKIDLTERKKLEKSAVLSSSEKKEPEKIKREDSSLKAARISAPALSEKKDPAKGGLASLLDAVSRSKCASSMTFSIAMRHIRKSDYKTGLDIISQSLDSSCEDIYFYLEAWARFTELDSDPVSFLDLIRDIESLLAKKPDSEFAPWAYAMLGVLFHRMNNDPVAMAYLDLLSESDPDFEAMAEVLLYRGRIYIADGEYDEAESSLKQLLNDFPDTLFALKARMELARVFFEKKRYFDTLNILETLVEEMPEQLLENPDFLLLTGNSHFHTGGHKKAIEALIRAYNDFPDIENAGIILTRVAESYEALGEKEKARNLYELVRKLYPGTEGFIVSSMRFAELLEDRAERDAIFQMIVDVYPEHGLVRLALMRLAESAYAVEDYDLSLQFIRNLLRSDPRVLRKDALELAEKALKAIFSDMLASGDYTELVRRYNIEKTVFFEIKSPGIHTLLARAYLMGHLYPQALEEYKRAELLAGGEKLPYNFYFEQGLAFFENDEDAEALEKFALVLKKTPPDNEIFSKTWDYTARIRLREKDSAKAVAAYKKASGFAEDSFNKADFLLKASRILRNRDSLEEERELLLKALSFLGEEGLFPDLRFVILRSLAESQLAGNFNEAAVLSYEKAESISGISEKDKNAVRFKLAESLELTGRFDKAADLYKNLVEDGDALWGALARERLASMDIEKQLQKS